MTLTPAYDAAKVAASQSSLTAVDDLLDTEVGAIKLVTDKLDTALELDGAVWRYTVNALEQAPVGGGGDTPGTTTLLSRIASAITITAGKVDVNDKTGFSLTAAYDPAKTAAQAGSAMTLTSGERTTLAGVLWAALTSGLTTIGSIGKLLVDNINATIASRSTYAGTDTAGTTTLLSRIASALTITAGKVDVNDKTGFSLTAAYDPAKTAAQVGAAMTLTPAYDAAKVAASQSSLTAVDDLLDTEVGAIKLVTDKLDTALELDGAVYRYTVNALEQAPVGGGGGATDWTSPEREQIRHRLGIDGTAVPPSATPSLATLGNQTTILNRLGAWAGSGRNTILGAMQAMFRKDADASVPSDINANLGGGAGAANNTTDSQEGIRDNMGVPQTGDSFVRIGAGGAGLTAQPWNAAWDTEVQSEVADALDAAIPGTPTANSINERIKTLDDANMPSSLATLVGRPSPLDAAGTRAAIGMGSANMDTQLSGIDAKVTGIKTSTDRLPLDPADASDIANEFTTVNGKLDVVDDIVGSDLPAVKAVTDKLDSALELDGTVYRYTTNALEQAPTGGGGGGGTNKLLLTDVWKWTTTVSASTGQIRGEVADWNIITELWINYISNNGSDLSTWLRNIAIGDTIRVQQADNAAIWNSYLVIGSVVDNGTWLAVPVALDEGAGVAPPNSGKNCSVSFFRVIADTDWTAQEREQIRHRLGIDGTAVAPVASPSLATQAMVNMVKLKTDNLPPDPADASDVAASFTVVNGKLDDIDTVTDKLDTTMEQDGDVWRFTENALEMAGVAAPAPPVPTPDSPCAQNPARTLGPTTETLYQPQPLRRGFNSCR